MNEGLSLLLSNLQSWHRWFKWGASSSIQHFGRALCLVKHNWFSVRLLPTNKSQSFCPPKMLYGEAFYPLEPQMPTVLLSLSLSLQTPRKCTAAVRDSASVSRRRAAPPPKSSGEREGWILVPRASSSFLLLLPRSKKYSLFFGGTRKRKCDAQQSHLLNVIVEELKVRFTASNKTLGLSRFQFHRIEGLFAQRIVKKQFIIYYNEPILNRF